jgi:CheY-like chemotaxis protein
MTGILGMTSLALEATHPPLDADHKELISAAHESANSLLRILDDLLDLSRIEAGKVDIQPHPFSIRQMMKDALAPFMAKAREKDLRLTFAISDEMVDRVLGDSTRLRQVVVNLVGNAIKFTRKGRVSVSVDLPDPTTRPTDVRFVVEDTGIGIPTQKLGLIFEPFTQADGTMSRVFGGTGLGLSISRELVSRMGGRLEVTSEEGKGSRFVFSVVLVPLATPGTPGSGGDGFESGEAVVSAQGGFFESTAGIKRIAVEGSPPLIPRWDTNGGHESSDSRAFPLSPPGPPTPREHKPAFNSGGASTKPVGVGSISSTPALAENQRSLRILLAEDNPVNQRLIERILQKVGHRVVSVGNGRLAVDAFLASIGYPTAIATDAVSAFPTTARESGSLLGTGSPRPAAATEFLAFDRAGSNMSKDSIEAEVEEKMEAGENAFDVILMDGGLPERGYLTCLTDGL